MQQEIRVVQKPISGRVQIPGSKSISNRALFLAALANGESILRGVLQSDDTEACITALQTLGVEIHKIGVDCLAVKGGGPFHNNVSIDCRDAGTVARLIVPILAVRGGSYHIYGSKRMNERPMQPVFAALQALGAQIHYLEKAGFLPIRLESTGLAGGEITVDIKDSSQFVSGLMLAAPFCAEPLTIHAQGLAHKPYIQMTARMMEAFQGQVHILDEDSLRVLPGVYSAREYAVEPDASTASYFFAAAALTAGEIFIPHLQQDMLQGDIRFLAVLEQMGAKVIFRKEGVSVSGPPSLQGLGEIDVTGFSDTFMTLAALAAFASGRTTIKGLRHTRLQESDRVAAMAEGLQTLGAKVETTEDSLTVYSGNSLHSGIVNSHNDHRIAMSLALAGLKVPGVVIDGAECVKKTCPDFFKLLSSLQ